MVAGSITVDQTVLNYKGKRRESLVGTPRPVPWPTATTTPEWKKFVADYKANFKDGFPVAVAVRVRCTTSTRKAALDALDVVKGDLSSNEAKYREALKKLTFKRPAGEVKIDENRNANRHHLHHRSGQGTRTAAFYNKVVKVGAQRQPDAGAVEGRLPEDGPGLARRAELPVKLG